jgi:hypothetical protein
LSKPPWIPRVVFIVGALTVCGAGDGLSITTQADAPTNVPPRHANASITRSILELGWKPVQILDINATPVSQTLVPAGIVQYQSVRAILRAMVQERSVRVERRLSAILAADVAGYSRLMHIGQKTTPISSRVCVRPGGMVEAAKLRRGHQTDTRTVRGF